jgi:hypothetical protein
VTLGKTARDMQATFNRLLRLGWAHYRQRAVHKCQVMRRRYEERTLLQISIVQLLLFYRITPYPNPNNHPS